MPRYLKSKTQDLIMGSQSHLRLALFGLAAPKTGRTIRNWEHCSEIGLIGSAAELAMSACIVEISKPQVLLRKDGSFLPAAEVLDLFRKNLRSKIPKLSVLTEGVSGPEQHLEDLIGVTANFKTLLKGRAGGLHAGGGVTYDVAFSAAKNVAEFYRLLSLSSRWEPYLKDSPALPQTPKEYKLIAEELGQLLNSDDKEKLNVGIRSIFLLLPEVPNDEPAWLKSLVRSYVAPEKNDISVLLSTLGKAKVGELIKVKGGTQGIAARIDQNNPNAIPIAYSNLKKEFSHPIEQWRAPGASARPT